MRKVLLVLCGILLLAGLSIFLLNRSDTPEESTESPALSVKTDSSEEADAEPEHLSYECTIDYVNNPLCIDADIRGKIRDAARNQKTSYTQSVENIQEAEKLLGISLAKNPSLDEMTSNHPSSVRFDFASSTAVSRTVYTQYNLKDDIQIMFTVETYWGDEKNIDYHGAICSADGLNLSASVYTSPSGMDFTVYNFSDEAEKLLQQRILFTDGTTIYTLFLEASDGVEIPNDFIHPILDAFEIS